MQIKLNLMQMKIKKRNQNHLLITVLSQDDFHEYANDRVDGGRYGKYL